MKDKRLVYGLLPVVGLIWGVIAYRLYEAQQPEPFTRYTENQAPWQAPGVDTLETVRTLNLSYADPFLKGEARASNERTLEPVRQDHQVAQVRQAKKLDSLRALIQYVGQIANREAGQKVALVRFEEQSYFLKVNDALHECKVQYIRKDSIGLQYRTLSFAVIKKR